MVGSKIRIFSAIECVSAVEGHPRSILVPIKSAHSTSYYVIVALSYLAPFLRYVDLLAENCKFSYPSLVPRPALRVFHLEFCGEVNHEETTVVGLSSGEDRMIVALA